MKNSKTQKKISTDIGGVKRSFSSRLRGYFITGILVTAPISITVYLTYLFLSSIDAQVGKFIPQSWYEVLYGNNVIPGFGLIIAIIFFMVIGWFATNILGRFFIRIAEYVVDRMPVIRTLYGAIKQIFETIMTSQSTAFREVVMFEYPRKGVWAIGFVTGVTEGEAQRLTSDSVINVFLPTTPNPTSGFLLFIPKKELKYLDMTVEEGVKMVVSAGIITPPERVIKKKSVRKSVAPKKAVRKTTTPKKK